MHYINTFNPNSYYPFLFMEGNERLPDVTSSSDSDYIDPNAMDIEIEPEANCSPEASEEVNSDDSMGTSSSEEESAIKLKELHLYEPITKIGTDEEYSKSIINLNMEQRNNRKSLKSYGITCFSALHAAKTSDAITL